MKVAPRPPYSLGHVSPAHTYWYLTVTPALAEAVSERAALYYQTGNRR